MPKPGEVTEDDFTTPPKGGTQDTFDDHLNKLDGTDPAENLSVIPPDSKDDGFPTNKEIRSEDEDEGKPVPPATDEDDDEEGAQTEKTTRTEELEEEAKKAAAKKAEPEESDEYTEGDRLKELGEDYDTIEEYRDAQKAERTQEADALRDFFRGADITLHGKTVKENIIELQTLAAKQPAAPAPEKKSEKTETTKVSTDDISRAIGEVLEQFDMSDGDPKTIRFHKRFAEAIAKPLLEKITGLDASTAMKQHADNLAQVAGNQDYFTDMALYDRAKAAAKKDDGPIPSLAEARKLVWANPNARDTAIARLQSPFGGDKDNPFLDAFAQWRGQKNAAGLTNADVARKREAAKVAKFKRHTRSGRGPDRTKGRPSDEAAEILATRKLPVSVLER